MPTRRGTHEVNANSQWSSQYEFWITPYGFLKGALADIATESKTEVGTIYKAVAFILPGSHTVLVETKSWGDRGSVVEALYRAHANFNGVSFQPDYENMQASLA